jgi:hypothetical protein
MRRRGTRNEAEGGGERNYKTMKNMNNSEMH